MGWHPHDPRVAEVGLGALAESGFGNRVAYGRRLPLMGSTGAVSSIAPAATL